MSIKVDDYQSSPGDSSGIFVIVVEGYTSRKTFIELLSRGANTWDHAPPEIKEFVDIVTVGKVLQDYKSQDSSRARANSNISCKDCGAILGRCHLPSCSELKTNNIS